jgi:hypothetical protein
LPIYRTERKEGAIMFTLIGMGGLMVVIGVFVVVRIWDDIGSIP